MKTLGLSEVTSPSSQKTDDSTLYLVQLGAFKNRKNAEALVKELKVKGYQAIIKEQR